MTFLGSLVGKFKATVNQDQIVNSVLTKKILSTTPKSAERQFILCSLLFLTVSAAYFFSRPLTQSAVENSLIPGGLLEAILLANKVSFPDIFPSTLLPAIIAALIAIVAYLIADAYPQSTGQKLSAVCFIVFGSWLWPNLINGSLSQLAISLAVLGQLCALYLIVVRYEPFFAGLSLTIAFCGRTEVLLSIPLLLVLLLIHQKVRKLDKKFTAVIVLRFLLIPAIGAILTLLHNYLLFEDPLNFGLTQALGTALPKNKGIKAVAYEWIAPNSFLMLFQPWSFVPWFPNFAPPAKGCSIFISSPYLLFCLRNGSLVPGVKLIAYLAITVLTLAIWCQIPDPGPQFAVSKASILLPWFYLLILETSPEHLTRGGTAMLLLSILLSGYAVLLFYWLNIGLPG